MMQEYGDYIKLIDFLLFDKLYKKFLHIFRKMTPDNFFMMT